MNGRLRVALAASAILLLTCLRASAAVAADGSAGLSDLKETGTALSGVLTFRGPSVIDVDPSTIKGMIDGESRAVSIQPSTHLQRTAMLVIDTSGSMGAAGMATVRSATRAYLKEAPSDVLIGVVTFADTAGVDLQPTLNRQAVQRVADGLRSGGDTSLYAAVRTAAAALGGDGERSMVLLSDGADTLSQHRASDLAKATASLHDSGIRVDVVRFNTSDPDASAALNKFASASGGSVVAANNAGAVGDAFQTAARALRSQALFSMDLPAGLSGQHAVQLSGVAAGKPFSVTQQFDFGTISATTPPTATPQPSAAVLPARAVKAASSPVLPWVAAVMIGLAVFLLAVGALTPSLQTGRERRLAVIASYTTQTRFVSRSEGKSPATPLSEQLVGFGDRVMKRRKSTAKTMELINRADLPLRAGEWFLVRVSAVVVAIALAVMLMGGVGAFSIALGAFVGAALPALWLRFVAARRGASFDRLLPQALMLVATSLRSGFGLAQALDAVAKDSPEPVAKEFSRALAETRIGTDISDSLGHAATRMNSRSLAMAIMAIRIQREVGGNLAETLETTAKTLREREALYRQVRALSAEGRLSAYILIALPIGLFFYMMWVNYEYISLLWTTGLGMVMLVGAIVMLFLGVIWMRQVVKIEV